MKNNSPPTAPFDLFYTDKKGEYLQLREHLSNYEIDKRID